MSEEQMSEEKEKMWEGYVERLRDFRDLFERYIRNEREMFEASQRRNEDLKEFVHRMADITYSFLGVVNRLIDLNFHLVEENRTLHRVAMNMQHGEQKKSGAKTSVSEGWEEDNVL